MLTKVGPRRHGLGRAGQELQRCLRLWAAAGRLHHLQVRHGRGHGGYSGQHRARDECAGAVCGRRAALLGSEELFGQVGG